MKPKKSGLFFFAIGIAFIAIAASGKQVAFYSIGAAFIVIGVAFSVKARKK